MYCSIQSGFANDECNVFKDETGSEISLTVEDPHLALAIRLEAQGNQMGQSLLAPLHTAPDTRSLREEIYARWNEVIKQLGTDSIAGSNDDLLGQTSLSNLGQTGEVNLEQEVERLTRAITEFSASGRSEPGFWTPELLVERIPGIGGRLADALRKRTNLGVVIAGIESSIRALTEKTNKNITTLQDDAHKKREMTVQLREQAQSLSVAAQRIQEEIAFMDPADPRRGILETDLLFNVERQILALQSQADALEILSQSDAQAAENAREEAAIGNQAIQFVLPIFKAQVAQALAISRQTSLVSASEKLRDATSALIAQNAQKQLRHTQTLNAAAAKPMFDPTKITAAQQSHLLAIEEMVRHRQERLPEIRRQIAANAKEAETRRQNALTARSRILGNQALPAGTQPQISAKETDPAKDKSGN